MTVALKRIWLFEERNHCCCSFFLLEIHCPWCLAPFPQRFIGRRTTPDRLLLWGRDRKSFSKSRRGKREKKKKRLLWRFAALSAQSEYSINRCTLVVLLFLFCAGPFQAKQNISVGSAPHFYWCRFNMRMAVLRKPKKAWKGPITGCLLIWSTLRQMFCLGGFNRPTARLCFLPSARREALLERSAVSSVCYWAAAVHACTSWACDRARLLLGPDTEEAGVRAERLICPEGSDK